MTTEPKCNLLLLTTDARLAHLIAAEAALLRRAIRVESTAECLLAPLPRDILLVLWDVGSVPLVATPPIEPPVIGFSDRELPLTPPLTRCYRRPLAMDRLRAEMLHAIAHGSSLAPEAAQEAPPLELQLPEDGRVLTVDGNAFSLTEAEAAIMRLLLRHRGEVVSKDALLRAVLDESKSGGQAQQNNSLAVHLCHLRQKVERPLGIRLIDTVRSQGYCLDPKYTHHTPKGNHRI